MSVADEIKARLDIVDYLRPYVDLRKAGRTWKACCPFHSEKTPSFVVDPDRQTWRCYGGCAEGGDLFSFVQKRENTDFKGALEILARVAGIELQKRTPQQAESERRKETLLGLLSAAADHYHQYFMLSPVATEARAYAKKRGLSAATVKQFQIGYAPNEWRFALDHLIGLGYGEADVLDAGVATRNEEKNSTYDRFRYRLIIPICDSKGQVIGFGGRAMDASEPAKYINSPQSAVFDKSATLFALHHARTSIRESETAVIVEGYIDAISAHQAGYRNVIAQMGTALTEPQITQLGKLATRIVLALDSDAAGVKATMRGLDAIRQVGAESEPIFMTGFNAGQAMTMTSRVNLDLRVLTVPDAKDPDELIRANPDQWGELVANARSVAEYVIDIGTQDLPVNAEYSDRERTARQLLPILIAVESDSQRYENVSRLALRLRISEKFLMQWAQELRARPLPARKKQVESVVNPPEPLSAAQHEPEDHPQQQDMPPDQSRSNERRPANNDSLQEWKILQALFRNPGILPSVDRTLRALDLEPLQDRDFQSGVNRELFRYLRACTAQYELEHDVWFTEHLPDVLKDDYQRLFASPFDHFMTINSGATATDLQHLLTAVEETLETALIECQRNALELRQLRLRRESVELGALQRETADRPETTPDEMRRLSAQTFTTMQALARLQSQLTKRRTRAH